MISIKEITKNIGKLEMEINKKRLVSNVSIIKCGENFIGVTAAHCIYDWYLKKYYENIFFKKDGKKIRVVESYLHDGWVEEGIVDFDTAFLKFENTVNNYDFKNIEPSFNLSHIQDYFIMKYQNKYFHKIIRKKSFYDNKYGSSLKGLKFRIPKGGSGSPWYINYKGSIYQNSNSAFSFKQEKNIIWGPHWGKEIKNIYDSVCESVEKENVIVHRYL